MGDIVIELARAGKLKSGAAYEHIPPPLALFPDKLERSEMTKYKAAMRVVSAVVTDDQEQVFRADTIDETMLIAKARALDLEVRRWIAIKKGVRLSGKLKANVFGVGSNARKLPDSVWPRPTGGLFGGLGGLFSSSNK